MGSSRFFLDDLLEIQYWLWQTPFPSTVSVLRFCPEKSTMHDPPSPPQRCCSTRNLRGSPSSCCSEGSFYRVGEAQATISFPPAIHNFGSISTSKTVFYWGFATCLRLWLMPSLVPVYLWNGARCSVNTWRPWMTCHRWFSLLVCPRWTASS